MSKKKQKKSKIRKRKEAAAPLKKKERAVPPQKKEGYITSVEEFDRWIHDHCRHGMVYRGLQDSGWYLSASLYRRLEINDLPNDTQGFINATKKLIEKAEKEKHHQKDGNEMKNLDLLAELQHIGAATCLIDFTNNPHVALWFACQPAIKEQLDKDSQGKQYTDGKIVALNTESTEKLQTAITKDEEKDIVTLLNEGQERLWKWSPSKQNYRIITQQSVFILGKGIIENKEIDETCFIDKEAKKGILRELEKHGISENFLFCDFLDSPNKMLGINLIKI